MSQLELFERDLITKEVSKEKEHCYLENGEYLFFPNFFSKALSDSYYDVLLKETAWKQEGMKMYGRYLQFPRLTAWYGDDDKTYAFSGITLEPEGWTRELTAIKEAIALETKVKFNSVLLNLYRNGSDSISWHRDNEKELGENPIIGSISFGGARKFQLKHIHTKEKK